MAWLIPCRYAVAQQVSNDSLKAVRQHITDSSRQAMQQHTDSIRSNRQQAIDSSRKLQQQRNDSLAAIRKHKESKSYKDSVVRARNEAINALRSSRTAALDSVKAIRKAALDSAVNARKSSTAALQQQIKQRSDSLNNIRKYRETKKYKDSVLRSRNAHIDSIRNTRTRYFDSLTAVRKKTLDSTLAIRKQTSDSMRRRLKQRTDSMAVIRKYKESKRYRDSVSIMRQDRLDSIRTARKDISDSMIAVRKLKADSLKLVRKTSLDSMMAVRKKLTDSLKAARAVRADSMAKVKELRLKNQKAQLKKREDKAKLALDLKIKKKHEAYSNEKMLKKKWTLIRQGFQNTYTRYNYYYNARRKMTEAQLNMRRRKTDDFEQRIPLFPFDPNIDSAVFASDMDTIIRKASVGIQIHDPRTKWGDDLYLLMGQAFYYKGNYESATATFRYIIGMRDGIYKKKKKKNTTAKKESGTGALVQKEKSRLARIFQHQLAHNDAVLWLTRTFTDSDREGDAEAILDLLDASAKLSDRMKGKIALEKANLMIKRGAYKEASTQLDHVIASKAISKYTRQRASFLNGQILSEMGEYATAAENYQKTLALHPQIEMDFYARKNMANSVALSGGDQTRSIASLKAILKDAKYAPYHEQIYFILGKLSANDGNYDQALGFYTKSLQLPKTSKKQKAVTFAAIGNIQYSQGHYNLAKRSYDSASFFSRNAAGNEELAQALLRGQSLDKVEVPYNAVKQKDSLLRLSAMTEKEQKAVIKKYFKYLEQQKADSAANSLAASGASSVSPTATTPGTATTWYFASPVAIQQGVNDFKRKWGSRSLADNWRRAAAAGFGTDASGNGSGSAATDEPDDTEDGGESPEESLMAAIPKTEAQVTTVRQQLRKAYITLAEAYIKNIEDYPAGVKTLDTLDARFADHEYGAQALSLRYLAALRQNRSDEAALLRTKLLSAFPDSDFAHSLGTADSADTGTAATGQSVSDYYTETYLLADNREYAEALQKSRAGQRTYGDAVYSRKFRILEAISLAGLGEYKHADTVISQYLKEYPSDSLKPWADAVARRIGELKAADTLKKADTSVLTMLKDSSKVLVPALPVADSVKVSDIPAQYSYKSREMHYCIFVFGKPDAKIAGFKSGLSDFSTFKFNSLGLSTSMEMLGKDNSMVVTKSFPNAAQARSFLDASKNESRLFRDIPPGSYQALIISAANFKKLSLDKNLAAYRTFYNKYYR